MAKAAPRPCGHPGCAALVYGGSYCERHARAPMPRPHGSKGLRKTGRAGVRDRERIRWRDCGLCQSCSAGGITTAGVVVDHILPLSDGGADSDDNKQLLCRACHDKKSAKEARLRAAGGR